MLDRTKVPPINDIKKATIIRAKELRLKNNIPVYYINAGPQDLVKIELLFPAGKWQQSGPFISSAANEMLHEGTSTHNGKAIAEIMDYYGAFLETGITHDFASVCVYSMNKHLEKVLPVVSEIISDSIFPEKEWNIYVQNKKQRFIVNNQKISVIARKKFAELLFGNRHPYGHNASESDFDRLKREEAYNFYKKSYTATDTIIVASGKVTDKILLLIEKNFSGLKSTTGLQKVETYPIETKTGQLFITKKDALQSAIRIGKMLFTKKHHDYPGMLVLNTIFGGYFGSRLMSNIREDKGYTYGIGSAVVSFTHAGYFTLSTEVGTEVTKEAIKEIYYELERIQTELVPESELQLVRNYMLGAFLRNIDGPFALADRFKGIYFHGLEYDYYDRYVETIQSITPSELRNLANKYLNKEQMIELIVGKK